MESQSNSIRAGSHTEPRCREGKPALIAGDAMSGILQDAISDRFKVRQVVPFFVHTDLLAENNGDEITVANKRNTVRLFLLASRYINNICPWRHLLESLSEIVANFA